jgi:hypothetical protein
MKKIEERNTAQSAEKAADSSKFMKSPSLRLNKQTIRTLTGAELRHVAGGMAIKNTWFSTCMGCNTQTCPTHVRCTS